MTSCDNKVDGDAGNVTRRRRSPGGADEQEGKSLVGRDQLGERGKGQGPADKRCLEEGTVGWRWRRRESWKRDWRLAAAAPVMR